MTIFLPNTHPFHDKWWKSNDIILIDFLTHASSWVGVLNQRYDMKRVGFLLNLHVFWHELFTFYPPAPSLLPTILRTSLCAMKSKEVTIWVCYIITTRPRTDCLKKAKINIFRNKFQYIGAASKGFQSGEKKFLITFFTIFPFFAWCP